MSDCCPRADGYHGPDCVEWWERAYGSEYDKRKKAESQVAALKARLEEAEKKVKHLEHNAKARDTHIERLKSNLRRVSDSLNRMVMEKRDGN